MASWQQTVILGFVGREPELRYTPSGTAVCGFSVAVTDKWNDQQSGEKREKTTWFKCTAWKQLAETCHQYVTKGMPVMVIGTVESKAYLDREGNAQSSLELTVREIQFLGRSEQQSNGNNQDEYQPHPDDANIPF